MLNDFRLKVFYTCAIKGNFTKAAKELDITQPAVSSHIAEIENDIHDQVFIRKKGSVVLTEKGKILMDYAERILHLYACAHRELVPQPKETHKHLNIAAPSVVAKALLPRLIESFCKVYSSTTVTILERDDEEMEDLLQSKAIDIAFTLTPSDTRETNIFATINISGSDYPMSTIYMISDKNSRKAETIENFIMTCKTHK
ncbi:MAG: LysR family transcriptional regulator [Bacteroidales bacterium]|nr:LysR family transcriptional regulator [Bacteroidales bacterium]MBO7255792.1 LysR family transcriptional regulator [Bacteroidales bacterium]MBO7284530.1 LysR family transcriptional regulator [Bacteroidales bacterium]MBO7323629.1 LysR family transcriptional regulator [Bacteroidales bacterium]